MEEWDEGKTEQALQQRTSLLSMDRKKRRQQLLSKARRITKVAQEIVIKADVRRQQSKQDEEMRSCSITPRPQIQYLPQTSSSTADLSSNILMNSPSHGIEADAHAFPVDVDVGSTESKSDIKSVIESAVESEGEVQTLATPPLQASTLSPHSPPSPILIDSSAAVPASPAPTIEDRTATFHDTAVIDIHRQLSETKANHEQTIQGFENVQHSLQEKNTKLDALQSVMQRMELQHSDTQQTISRLVDTVHALEQFRVSESAFAGSSGSGSNLDQDERKQLLLRMSKLELQEEKNRKQHEQDHLRFCKCVERLEAVFAFNVANTHASAEAEQRVLPQSTRQPRQRRGGENIGSQGVGSAWPAPLGNAAVAVHHPMMVKFQEYTRGLPGGAAFWELPGVSEVLLSLSPERLIIIFMILYIILIK